MLRCCQTVHLLYPHRCNLRRAVEGIQAAVAAADFRVYLARRRCVLNVGLISQFVRVTRPHLRIVMQWWRGAFQQM
jgi:hypothetical protein